MGKLIVGLARFLPLFTLLLLLPVLAASQPAPLQPGLYTGMTSQVSGCADTDHPSTTCEIRFNIAATLDRLSPSPLVEEVRSATNRCVGGTGAEWLVVSRCSNATVNNTVVEAKCPSSTAVTITNGHWEFHHALDSTGVSFDLVADCAGQSCAGTYRITSSDGCQTGPLTWSATATGSAATSASSAQTMEGAPVDGQVEWIYSEVDENGVMRIIRMPDESK